MLVRREWADGVVEKASAGRASSLPVHFFGGWAAVQKGLG